MAQQKKNMSCLGTLICIPLLLIALGALATLSFYGAIIVGAIFLIIYFCKFNAFAIKKIYSYIKQKYTERVQSGRPTFMRKLLDFLNLNKRAKNQAQKMITYSESQPINQTTPECNSYITHEEIEEITSNKGESEVLYKDKYNGEYRNIDTYREIKFTEKKFHVPEVQICAAILLDRSKNGSRIMDNSQYPLYFARQYGIVNISRLHQWLYEQGYLRPALLSEALRVYKVSELKRILESLGLKQNGNKLVLINRIIDSIDDTDKERILNQCDSLFMTEKGWAFLQANNDYVMYHKKSYHVSFEEFNKHRIVQGKKRQFYDTIFRSLSERSYTLAVKQYYSRLEMTYYNLSEVLYDEGKYDLSLRNALFRLYFSTNLASSPYLFDIENIRCFGIEEQKKYIRASNTVIFNKYTLQRIIELKEYYNELILDNIYGLHILPYTIFDKFDLADAIYDLLNNIYFDSELYTDYICTNYENYIKQFL